MQQGISFKGKINKKEHTIGDMVKLNADFFKDVSKKKGVKLK